MLWLKVSVGRFCLAYSVTCCTSGLSGSVISSILTGLEGCGFFLLLTSFSRERGTADQPCSSVVLDIMDVFVCTRSGEKSMWFIRLKLTLNTYPTLPHATSNRSSRLFGTASDRKSNVIRESNQQRTFAGHSAAGLPVSVHSWAHSLPRIRSYVSEAANNVLNW